MPVCKYFLENRCRFDENCRFEHPRGGGAQRNLFGGGGGNWGGGGGGGNWGGGGGGGNQKVSFRDSFGGSVGNPGQHAGGGQFKWTAGQQAQGQGPGSQQFSTADYVNNLPNEMEQWEKNKMWPFSCISVEKDLPSLPDLYDISVEEVRLEAYEAIKSGTLQAYAQKFQGLVADFQAKRQQYKHMSMELKQKLITFINDARRQKDSQSGSGSLFGSSGQSQSPFGQASGSGSGAGLFGKPAGGAASTFGGNSSSSGGLFGQNQSSGTFGKPVGQGSLFGGGQMNTQNSSTGLFGSTSSASSGAQSVFGGGQMLSQGQGSMFAGARGSQAFGFDAVKNSSPGLLPTPNPTPSPAAPSVFGGTNSSASGATPSGGALGSQPGLLGNPTLNPAPSGLFGSAAPQAPATLFGKPVPNTGSLLGSSASGQPPSQPLGTGLFGKGASATTFGSVGSGPGTVGGSSSTSSTLHTPMEQLTDLEKTEFQAASFTLGRIPIRPPPKELINI